MCNIQVTNHPTSKQFKFNVNDVIVMSIFLSPLNARGYNNKYSKMSIYLRFSWKLQIVCMYLYKKPLYIVFFSEVKCVKNVTNKIASYVNPGTIRILKQKHSASLSHWIVTRTEACLDYFYYYVHPLYWVSPVADQALLRSHGKVLNTLNFWLSTRPRVSTLWGSSLSRSS